MIDCDLDCWLGHVLDHFVESDHSFVGLDQYALHSDYPDCYFDLDLDTDHYFVGLHYAVDLDHYVVDFDQLADLDH